MVSCEVSVAQCSTFVYLSDPGVPVVSLCRHVCDVPHAPQDLEDIGEKAVGIRGYERQRPSSSR